jgi:starvation-inducible outer membrane lipoprotein
MRSRFVLSPWVIAFVCACAPAPLFPAKETRDVDGQFDFDAWRVSPSTGIGRTVQIGGRIIQAEETEAGVQIVAQQLPIVNRPAYGPTDTGRRRGSYEFAFLFPDKLQPRAITAGNRFIVIGVTQRPKVVVVSGAPKTEPYLLARCVHIWKTEGREISDFPYLATGYYPLEEDTYCGSPQR